jgi:hypothetical protein
MKPSLQAQLKFTVSIRQLCVLMHNLLTCKDADNDADNTKAELIQAINSTVRLDKSLLESLLYCCNMNHEDGEFWHPEGRDFDTFLKYLFLAPDIKFDKDYNQIKVGVVPNEKR